MPKPVVLIVHEQTYLVDLLKETLRNEDLVVAGASEAVEAAGLFHEHQPNLAVIDPELPGAMHLLSIIRMSVDRCAVIALTSSSEQRKQLHEMGIETVIDRGVSLKVLLRALPQARSF